MRIKQAVSYLIISVLFSLHVFAQEKIKFNSINMGGLIIGANGNSAVIQTLNGVTYKNLFTGIGVGIDYYKNRTIPLFFDLRTSIPKTNFFVFADPGYNFPSNNRPDDKVSYFTTYDFSGGFYSELGLGYKVRLSKRSALLFSSGFSYKELNNKTGIVTQCLIPPCPVDYTTYKYTYSRIALKAGVSL